MLPATSEQSKAVVNPNVWGSEGMSTKDLVIPKIQIAQAVSNACKEGMARPGEIIHSSSNEVLAAKGHKLQILPILCVGSWVVSKLIPGGQPEFMRREKLTFSNDSDDWKLESFEDGIPVVWNKCLSFLVLPLSRVTGFPFFVDFQKTNRNGGKILSTIIQENSMAGMPAPGRVVELSTAMRSYKNNSWFVFQVAASRKSTIDELVQCKKWYDLFSKSQIKEAAPEVEEDNGIS